MLSRSRCGSFRGGLYDCISDRLGFAFHLEFIYLLSSEGQLGDHIGIGGIAVEGIGFRGDIEAVFLPEPVEIIFHMEAVHTLGGTVDMVILPPVMAVDGEAVFIVMAHLCLA